MSKLYIDAEYIYKHDSDMFLSGISLDMCLISSSTSD